MRSSNHGAGGVSVANAPKQGKEYMGSELGVVVPLAGLEPATCCFAV
jgi:hypothetical protein